MFLKAREVCPEQPSSMFEIGFLIMGKKAIYLICFAIWITSFFLIVIFVNVWSATALGFVKTVWLDENSPAWLLDRSTYAIGIAALLLPATFMKEIAELHFVSMSLFSAAVAFVLINISQIFFRNQLASNIDNQIGISVKSYFVPKLGTLEGVKKVIDGASAIFTGSNFSTNLFPIHSNQIDKSIKGSAKNFIITLSLV
jgi:amino acid permease